MSRKTVEVGKMVNTFLAAKKFIKELFVTMFSFPVIIAAAILLSVICVMIYLVGLTVFMFQLGYNKMIKLKEKM